MTNIYIYMYNMYKQLCCSWRSSLTWYANFTSRYMVLNNAMSMVWLLLDRCTKANLIHSEIDHSVFRPHSHKGSFI